MTGFDPDGLGASQSEAANVGKSSFDRSVVITIREANVFYGATNL